jgi:hypothetical protein
MSAHPDTESPRARSERLQKAWADGDVGALIEALLSALEGPHAPDARIGIDRWSAEAALLYVCDVAGVRVNGRRLEIPRPKRGRGGRWATAFLHGEISDLFVYRRVTEAREGGTPIGKAIAHVAGRREAEDAVRKAYGRARDRLMRDPRRYDFLERLLGPMRNKIGDLIP